MREDILAGGDMGALVDEYGSALRDTRVISQRVPLSAVDDPQLLAFAQSAEEGSLSELLPLTGPGGEVQGYQIARIVSRTSGQAAPDFEDPDLQVRIAERLQQTWDNKRIQVGSEQLWRSAFIRHPPALAVRPPWDRR